MRLNHKKSHIMNFNFTRNYQLTTRIQMEGQTLPVLNQTKLLGVIITSDLRWSENTKHLIKRANARMERLRRMVQFNPPIEDMKTVYITYIRSILEQSCTIWHSDLAMEDRIALERVQKNAFRNILQNQYESYEKALVDLNMETLHKRRENLMLTYGRNCTTLPQTRDLFPLNKNYHSNSMNTKNSEKYEVLMAHTSRFQNSTVPYIQRLLNQAEKGKRGLQEDHDH